LVNKKKVENKNMDKFIETFSSTEDAANHINNFFAEICTSKMDDHERKWTPKYTEEPIPQEALPTKEEVY
jgi:hypothetical protein